MKRLKKKKFVVSLVGIILMFVLVVGIQVKASANERFEEYHKYCENDCDLTKVTSEDLEQTIDTRKESAIASIEKSNKTINETTNYLKDHELNDDESKTFESLKLKVEYSKDKEYTVDELIEIETDYSEVAKKLSDLKTVYRTRYLISQIKSNQKAINKTKTSLKDYDLTTEETETKKSLDKKLTFDSEKEYTVDELSELNKTYKLVKSDYSTLLSDVKDRVTTEKAQAEVIIQEQAVDYTATEGNTSSYISNDETDYSNDTSGSTIADSGSGSNSSKSTSSTDNSSNNNTSSSNTEDTCYDEQGRFNSACMTGGTIEDNGVSQGGRVCEFQSENEAWAYGEANMHLYGGFGVYPCSGGTWEIDWFEQ